MRIDRSNLSLAFGLFCSLFVHAAFLPLVLQTVSPNEEPSAVEVTIPAEAVTPPDEPSPVTPLGIEAGTPSSLAWIGHQEYLEHLAAREEFEQAAFTQGPMGEHGHVPAELVPEELAAEAPEPLHAAVESQTVIDESSANADTLQQQEPVLVEADTTNSSTRTEQPSQSPTPRDLILMALIEAAQSAPLLDASHEQQQAEPTADQPPVESTEEAELMIAHARPAQTQAETEPAMPSPQSTAQQQPVATPAGEPAHTAEKESPATSLIDVPPDHWRLGKPLAAEGVELKPQRPQFSIVQMLTVSPRNPIVELHFKRDGVPSLVTMPRTTGSDSIDATLIASLYRWRASGEALEQLPEDETFIVRIQIILTRRG